MFKKIRNLIGIGEHAKLATLSNYLAAHKGRHFLELSKRNTISLQDITKWHTFDFNYETRLWSKSSHKQPNCDALQGRLIPDVLGLQVAIDSYECDISAIQGFTCSKSNLSEFDSIDKMIITNRPGMIAECTNEVLRRHLQWPEIRIINQVDSSDSLVFHAWDGRLFLSNSGGSHHFAAARYIAGKLDEKVTIQGRLKINYLCPDTISDFNDKYASVAINLPYEFRREFITLVLNCGIQPLTSNIPCSSLLSIEFGDEAKTRRGTILLLPKDEPIAVKVHSILVDAGLVDFGLYISDLIDKQNKYADEFGFKFG